MRAAARLFLLLVMTSVVASAQVSTGIPPFSSFGGGPFDQINLGNLNVHFAIPILHKAGRGLPFDLDLTYDSSIWTPEVVSGTTQWVPNVNWGWSTTPLNIVGYLAPSSTYTQRIVKCTGGFGTETTYTTTYAYIDQWRTAHPFPGSTYYVQGGGGCSGTQYGPTLVAVASDNSGLTLTAHANQNGDTVTNRQGIVIYTNVGGSGSTGSVEDNNGNEINVNVNTGQFYDTLSSSTPVLTQAGSGTPLSPVTYTYTAPSGGNASYTINYTQYTVATDFGVSGVTEYGPASIALVSSVSLPDGTQYTFQYEQTPGSCTPLANTYSNYCVTGRLAYVQLPTGGSITYAYSGGSNGIFSDGSTAGIKRTLSPGGQWQYSRSLVSGTPGPGSTWTTTVNDPSSPSNTTVINFAEDNAGSSYNMYETQRLVYQGSSVLLATIVRCYNANYTSCGTAGVGGYIADMNVYTQLPNGSTRLSALTYDNTYGMILDDKEYDYGVTMGSAPGTAHLVQETKTTLAGGGEPAGLPGSVSVYDWTSGSQVLLSSTTYSYDQTSVTATSGTPQHEAVSWLPGNLTTLASQASSSGTTLYQTFTYYDTGNLNTSTGLSTSSTSPGPTTTYNYASGVASCYNSFVTSISEPLSLSRSFTWYCTGGVEHQVIDENTQYVITNYTDPYFWRPSSISDQEYNSTSIVYPSENAAESTLAFNGTQSVADILVTVDGFGRPILSQRKQSPTATNYDTTETDYNVVGLPSKSTMPFSASSGGLNSSAPGVGTLYDALGRPYNVTDADGGTTTYTYNNNDVLVTVSGTGAQSFKKQLEYDGLGRLSSVCEISTTLPGVGTCGQSTSQTGYWTKYTYDALGHLLTVTQNAQASSGQQTRQYWYDMLGRLIKESNPETSNNGSNGITTYTYDSVSPCADGNNYSYPGDLVERTDNANNSTCYAYDALNRLTQAGNSAASNTTLREYVYDSESSYPSGVSVSYGKARMVEAKTVNTSNPGVLVTDEFFSYSPRGELTDFYESTPHSGGYYHTTASYWPSGALETLSGIPSAPELYYGASNNGGAGLDGEGRYTQVTAAFGTNPVTSVSYSTSSTSNPLGALTDVTYGSSDSDSFSYDPNTGRPSTYTFLVNGNTDAGTLNWNTNGTLGTLSISDNIPDTSDSQSCTSYAYDDLERVSGVNCGTTGSQSFSYDPFGNISKTANGIGLTFQPSSYSATNQPVVTGMSFDTVGETQTDNLGNSYTWDTYGDMASVNSTTAIYDALGQMVELSTSPGCSGYAQILYSPAGKVALMCGATLSKAFLNLPGGGTAVYTPSGLAYYRHADWLGSSRLSSTQSRALYSSTAYAPFGEQYGTAENSDASFTGQDSGTIASLYDFAFRRLSPSQGRWISPDPAGLAAVDPRAPQTWNRYAYVANGPLNSIDPLGLQVDGPGTCSISGDSCYAAAGGLGGDVFFNEICTLGGDCTAILWGQGEEGSYYWGGIFDPGGVSGGLDLTLYGGAGSNNASCAGKTVRLPNNWRIQSNNQGIITAIGIPLTGNSDYVSGSITVPANTVLGVGLGSGGALTVAVSNPIYYHPGAFGALISSATYNKGSFTQVNGAVTLFGVPLGSSQTPSSYLLNQFNQNSSLSNTAGLLQSAAQLGQQLVGCSTVAQ